MLSTLVLTLWAAGAAQGTVALLPVEIAEFGGQTATRRAEVEDVLRSVLGPRLRKLANGTPVCEDAKCFRMLAEGNGADEVAHIVLRRRLSNGYGDLTVRVYDADGELVLAITETLPEERPEEALRQVVTRAFDAALHAGRVEVVGLEPGDHLFVDGLPMTEGLAQLSVGPHVVTARSARGRERSVTITVPFKATVRAQLPPGMAPAAESAPRPLWPALLSLGVGVGGLAMAGGAIPASLFDAQKAVEARDVVKREGGLPLPDGDPAGTKWSEGYGEPRGEGSSTPAARARFTAISANLAEANEIASTALYVMVGAGVLVAVTGVVGTWLLWPASDSE